MGRKKKGSDKLAGAPASGGDDFALAAQATPSADAASASKGKRSKKTGKKTTRRSAADNAEVLSYRYGDKRKNNPEVGMVKPENDPDQPRTTWAYDPHIDPALQFDSGRAKIETLIEDALAEGAVETERQRGEVLAWLDQALAGADESAVREAALKLRSKLASGKIAEERATDNRTVS